jgi:hypothetical protein
MSLPIHVALVSDDGRVGPDELAHVAGALNRQVQEDFAPVWHVRATVGAYPSLPAGTWGIHVVSALDDPGALGFHTDDHFQPLAYVLHDDAWTVTASHELLEMLADPWGSRFHGGRLPHGIERRFAEFGLKSTRSHVSYLVEVCDPPEAWSYDVGGVAVSDFITPRFYDVGAVGVPYSHMGRLASRGVGVGGYVSFHVRGVWWQVFNRRGGLEVRELGRFDRSSWGSVREWTDHMARVAVS